jgi:CRP/FNR family cyclic AMP-dependent transcriptional regulator
MKVPAGKRSPFNLRTFLFSGKFIKKEAEFREGETIFSEGQTANTVFYIISGGAKLTVVSRQGKEAIVGLLGPGSLCGEECVAGHPVRIMFARATSLSCLLQIGAREIIRLLHENQLFSDWFVSYLISSTIRVEEDLAHHFLNSAEKRLARVLLILARYGTPGKSESVIPRVSQATLAAMVGTTRPWVSMFMNKFRKLGFIRYNGGLEVNDSLLNFVLHE